MLEELQVLEVAHRPNQKDSNGQNSELSAQVERVAEVVAVKGGKYTIELIADYYHKCDTNTKTGDKYRDGRQVFDSFATH